MTTPMTAVQGTRISHALFIDLTLGNVTYYISSAFRPITISGNVYTELGSFLNVGEVTDDLKTTNGDITITLSGIPSDANYMDIVLSTPIKGGSVRIRRGFFDPDAYTLLTGQLYERYRGVITNYVVDETVDIMGGELTNTIGITCASINTVLENKIAGQRTNTTDRQRYFPGDISFDRVKVLQNTSFDFGKKYTGASGYGGYNGGGGGGGGRDFDGNNVNEN